MRVGYPCMNIYLRNLSDGKIRCNRSCHKKSLDKYGVGYLEDKCEKNLEFLYYILKWNVCNDIYFYRISSDLIPWFGKHYISELSNSDYLLELLSCIGDFILENDMRVSFHPDYFVKLGSDDEDTVSNSVDYLEYHGEIMDLMGLDRSYFYPINIHVGGVYDGKEDTADRFVSNYEELNDSVKDRLVVENDDISSCWSVFDLMGIYDRVGIPVVFDSLHYRISGSELSLEESFNQAYGTWGGFTPVVHHSDSGFIYEGADSRRSHSDWIYNEFGLDGEYDLMLEAGKKEQAVFKYKYDFLFD
jgi:UV DNA damage endonuclease